MYIYIQRHILSAAEVVLYFVCMCRVMAKRAQKGGLERMVDRRRSREGGYVDGISAKKKEESELGGISRMKFGSVVSRCIQIVFSL